MHVIVTAKCTLFRYIKAFESNRINVLLKLDKDLQINAVTITVQKDFPRRGWADQKNALSGYPDMSASL